MTSKGPSRRRRACLATLAVGVLAAAGLAQRGTDPAEQLAVRPTATPAYTSKVERPNVLLITADDLSYLDMEYLPTVRKLIERAGVTFSDALAPTPICVPARASLLTGQYAHNHGAVTISGPRGGYAAFNDHDTVATALQAHGYDTLFTGKYLNGYGKDGTEHDIPPGWTQWRATLDPSTYRFFSPRMNINGELGRQKGYTTDIMTRQAEEMVTAERGSGRSWFAWVNYVAPHSGGPVGPGDPRRVYAGTDAAYQTTVPDKKDRDLYTDVQLPERPDMFPTQTSHLPAHSPSQQRYDARQRAALTVVNRRRLQALASLDRNVGHLLQTLRKNRQLKRTLVIFTSDNGFAIGPHNVHGKRWYYDEVLQIPVLMRGPGVPRARTVRTAISNPDIATTILAVTGAREPRPQDGIDLMPWLRAPQQVRVIPIEAWRVKNGLRSTYWGVRVGTWTYIRFRAGGDEEVYDRSGDPYEMHDLAHDPRYAAQVEALRRLALRYQDCAGDTCPQRLYRAASPVDLANLADP